MFYIYVVLVISICILYCIYAPCYPIATQLHVLLSHTPTPHSTYQCVTVTCYRSIFSFFFFEKKIYFTQRNKSTKEITYLFYKISIHIQWRCNT